MTNWELAHSIAQALGAELEKQDKRIAKADKVLAFETAKRRLAKRRPGLLYDPVAVAVAVAKVRAAEAARDALAAEWRTAHLDRLGLIKPPKKPAFSKEN